MTDGRLGLDEAGRRHDVVGTTVFRWITKGIRVGDRRIKLRGEYEGRRLYTAEAWLDDFHADVTAAKLARHAADLEDLARDEATDEDDEDLVAAGIAPASLDR